MSKVNKKENGEAIKEWLRMIVESALTPKKVRKAAQKELDKTKKDN